MSAPTLAGEGALWLQPDGPNSEPLYLGCHALGDIQEPLGDVQLMYCPDPSQPNKFKVIGSFQQVAGAVTTSVTTDVNKTADYLEDVKCPATLFVHKVSCGRKDLFTGYDRSFVLRNVWISQRQLSKMAARTAEDQDRSEQTFEISAENMHRVFQMVGTRLTTAETEDMYSISNCGGDGCAGDCGEAVDAGDAFVVGSGLLAGSALNRADVLVSSDGGVTISAVQTKPFAAAELVSAVRCFKIDRDTTRYIAARGTTDAGNPAEVAISDDGGVTWTSYNVGSVNGQYVLGHRGMFVLDPSHIWLVTSGGYVYFSSDMGVTWTVQNAGVATAQNLYGVAFSDAKNGFAVGASNAIISTIDGGGAWNAVTGPSGQSAEDILTLAMFNKNRVMVGYDNGKLYFTNNAGSTWTERTFSESGTGAVNDIHFYDELIGMMVKDNATPVGKVFMTIDGGYNWQAATVPTNAGLTAVEVVTPKLAYVVGKKSGTTAMIMRVEPAS